jgi:hypothetical protein
MRLRACWVVQGPSGWPGHAQDVQGAVADLEREQDVEPLQRDSAVDVLEVHGHHRGGLGAQELARAGVGGPRRRRGIRWRRRMRRILEATDVLAEREQFLR